jgi:hypothetical protein
MSRGFGAVQQVLLAALQKQPRAINTMSLLRIICDGNDPTPSQRQSGRRALWALSREGAITVRKGPTGAMLWRANNT